MTTNHCSPHLLCYHTSMKMNERMTFEDILESRHSVRRFRPEPVPEPLLRRLLTLATRAPSAHNAQPWRFAVITGAAAREQLARAMGREFRRDLEADGASPEAVEAAVGKSLEMIGRAPVAVVLCLSMEEMERYPDPARSVAERTMAVQSAALAGGQLLLAAHAWGLGGVWLCAPLFCPGCVREILELPATWEPQGLLLLGYPEDGGEPGPRKPLDEVTRWYRNG